MIDAQLRDKADQLLEAVMKSTGARDPREFYRDRLRVLKHQDAAAYETAVRHYEEVLVPSVADETEEPLAAWTEYGRRLAELSAPGRTVSIDATGRAEPYQAPPIPSRLVIHMPDAPNQKALLVGLPTELTDAQRATYDWLVVGRRGLKP